MRALIAATAIVVLGLGIARADDPSLLHRREKSYDAVKPVNVDVPYGIVIGTVTVRARGVLVDPQEVTYNFQPEFPNSLGYLWRVSPGTYVLRASKVPIDESHTLNIRAIYNDTVVRDGVVQRMGQTTSGTLTLQIPHGRDLYSFGDQLLDLR